MTDKESKKAGKYFKIFIRVLLFLISVAIIVYLFPKEGKFRYEFREGSPWLHETLIAPYDFPVYKTDQELKAELDSTEKEANAYFNLDAQMLSKQLKVFSDDFNEKWSKHVENKIEMDQKGLFKKLKKKAVPEDFDGLKKRYYQFSKKILDFIYTKGVVKGTKEFKEFKQRDAGVVIVKDNIAQEVNVNEIFTIETAEEYAEDEVNNAKLDSVTLVSLEIDFYDELVLEDYILPNLLYDDEATNKVIGVMKSEVSNSRGLIQEGEKIISEGDIVSGDNNRALISYKKEYESRMGTSKDFYIILIGHIILTMASIVVLFLFLLNFRPDTLHNLRRLIFILFLVVIFVFIGSMSAKWNDLSIYVIPFAILPIIIRIFYDPRLALFIHLITMLIVGFLAPNAFEFVFLQVIAGIVAIFSLDTIKRRGKLFFSSAMVFASYSIVYFGMAVIQEGNFKSIEWTNFAWFSGNGLLLLSSYPLIYIFERLFGFLSDVTLLELSDTNHPVLRKLNENAPGTFQHSLQVANLAEEAIYEIGGNPLLARTGALFHDIGKMEIPQYFIENQAPGINPHDKLDYDKSAEVIISHVYKGIEIARKYKLPQQISDFITTHQGDSKVGYFYTKYKNDNPDKEVDASKFTYPGPTPYSKETVVVMMADAVEAASRSLKEYTPESIGELVDKIINFQMNEGQFNDADITLKDISIVKEILKRKIKNIYHSRIEYPEEIKANT